MKQNAKQKQFEAARKARSNAIALGLVGFVVVVFFASMVKFGFDFGALASSIFG